ncbi:helix-turn-helix domain-containing protein [Escherichia coli]|uniref:helix-turn-helix domain-containing protein n=1 Tax=Escherichia coli TaxID=562 RepID=UPI00388D56A1
MSNCYCGAWKRLTSRSIRRWIIGYARLVSTSAITADSNFDIASVAQHVCLSPSRLSHLFRQQLGISVLSWREDQRISQAKLLLSTTRMPIATVGRNVGFDDQLYFSRVFKNAPGPARASLGLDVNNKKEGESLTFVT